MAAILPYFLPATMPEPGLSSLRPPVAAYAPTSARLRPTLRHRVAEQFGCQFDNLGRWVDRIRGSSGHARVRTNGLQCEGSGLKRDDRRDGTLALGQWAQGRGRQAAESPLPSIDPVAIGAYRLLGRLGSGGMGVVYLGQAPGGQPVAVKVIRADLAVDPAYRARFVAEVDSAKKVASFCTAGVLDHGED